MEFGNPEMYLGAKLSKTKLHNSIWTWAMNPMKYVHDAVRNCNAHLVASYSGTFRLPKRADNPFKMGYDPEFNTSPELELYTASYFQTIIGV